jgi:hypothetical protein
MQGTRFSETQWYKVPAFILRNAAASFTFQSLTPLFSTDIFPPRDFYTDFEFVFRMQRDLVISENTATRLDMQCLERKALQENAQKKLVETTNQIDQELRKPKEILSRLGHRRSIFSFDWR